MCRYLHILDERWGLPDVRPSADTFRPVANWPAMSSRDDNEGRCNQNTRGVPYVFKHMYQTIIMHHRKADVGNITLTIRTRNNCRVSVTYGNLNNSLSAAILNGRWILPRVNYTSTSKHRITNSLWVEYIRVAVSLTKSQQWGRRLHLMTSSWTRLISSCHRFSYLHKIGVIVRVLVK